jgi:hypothetical protein
MITQEEYLKNRIKLSKEETVWTSYDDEPISPENLVFEITKATEKILDNGGVDANSLKVYIDQCDRDYPSIDITYDRWETMEEYEERMDWEEAQNRHDLQKLKFAIARHFDEACEYVNEIREKRKEDESKRTD